MPFLHLRRYARRHQAAWPSAAILTLYALLGGVGPCAATGAAPGLLSEGDVYGDIPVVLSVTRLAQPAARAPAATTVLDRQMIEASGARTIPDLFRLVPGFVVAFERAHRGVVAYHGLSDSFSRRMQVLVDGRSVYLPSFGGVIWSDLPLSIADIERIEVVRGPNTAAYGANAFQGIINIQTRSADERTGAYAQARVGTDHIRDGTVRYASSDSRLAWRITAERHGDDGFVIDEHRTTQLTSRLDLRPTPNDHLMAQLGGLDGARGEGEPDSPDNGPRTRDVTARFLHVRWQRKLGVEQDVQLQFFHNFRRQAERYVSFVDVAPFGVVGFPLDYAVRSHRYDLEVQHRFRSGPRSRIVWGLNLRRDSVDAPEFFPDGEITFDLARGFANMEWLPADRLTVNLGAMVEHNDFTGSRTSPRAALAYELHPDHTLRAVYSEATRIPSVLEERANQTACVDPPACSIVFPVVIGNPNLRPERIISRELGYFGRPLANLLVDAKIYRNSLTDLTSLVGGYIENRDWAELTGFEAQLDYRMAPGRRLFAAYAHTNVHSSAERAVQSMPEQAASVLYMHEFPTGWSGSVGYYYYSSFRPLDGDRIPEVRRLDTRLAKEFRADGSVVRIALVAQNLLDEYSEYRTENVFDTRVFLSLELSY